jgi:hypothetical protein
VNIRLRTSGGRGEYELAGSQGGVRVADVVGRSIIYSITPEISIPGRSKCLSAREDQGKPRIRLENKGNSGETHAYHFLSSLLMLPEPIRELSQTGRGPLVLENDKFSIDQINVDVTSVTADTVVLRPTAIEFRNAADNRSVLIVADRMAKVLEVWRAADAAASPISELVRQHREIALNSPQLHSELNAAAKAIQQSVRTTGDYIGLVADTLGASLPEPEVPDEPIVTPPPLPVEDPTQLVVAKRRNVKVWRKQVVRGPEAVRFRQDVRNAYGSRCAFSGVRLPKLPITYAPGVDAAHILPWSRYEMNHVSNGICLSKLFHWAFDNGIVRLDFMPLTARYQLSIPDIARDAARHGGMDLDPLLPHLGVLPVERFPSRISFRPKKEFLEQLNAELF